MRYTLLNCRSNHRGNSPCETGKKNWRWEDPIPSQCGEGWVMTEVKMQPLVVYSTSTTPMTSLGVIRNAFQHPDHYPTALPVYYSAPSTIRATLPSGILGECIPIYGVAWLNRCRHVRRPSSSLEVSGQCTPILWRRQMFTDLSSDSGSHFPGVTLI